MLRPDTLEHYISENSIEWADSLKENCPPIDILVPEDEEVYRFLCHEDYVTEEDWQPYSKLYPEKKFPKELEILCTGLSVFDADVDTILKRFRSPYMKKKFHGIAKLRLFPKDGVLVKSHGLNHYTWWRTKNFDYSLVEIVNLNEKA